MKKIYIDGKYIATIATGDPHGRLRDMMIDAQLGGRQVEIKEA